MFFGRCSCNFSQDELLIGALEYRCCREVICAIGKSIFDGSIERITCIIQHEDYIAMSNEAVLSIWLDHYCEAAMDGHIKEEQDKPKMSKYCGKATVVKHL